MRKAIALLALLAVLGLALTAAADKHTTKPKSETWTGWISDSACAAKGTMASHKDCAVKCVKEKGAQWVFVSGGKVYNIHNQDAVTDDAIGQEVKLTGYWMEDKSLHVEKIEPAATKKSASMK